MNPSTVDEDTQPHALAENIDNIRVESPSARQQSNRLTAQDEESSVDHDKNETDKQPETLAPPRRIATERGKSEKIERLRQRRITALCAVTRQRNALSALMTNSNNLHLVKLELNQLEERFIEYRRACDSHLKELTEGVAKDAVIEHNKLKEEDIAKYLSQVSYWITEAEYNLSDRLDSLSSKASNRTRHLISPAYQSPVQARQSFLLGNKKG